MSILSKRVELMKKNYRSGPITMQSLKNSVLICAFDLHTQSISCVYRNIHKPSFQAFAKDGTVHVRGDRSDKFRRPGAAPRR